MTAGTIVRFKHALAVIGRPMRWDAPNHRYIQVHFPEHTPGIVIAGGRDPNGCVHVKIIFQEIPFWVPEWNLEVMGHTTEPQTFL